MRRCRGDLLGKWVAGSLLAIYCGCVDTIPTTDHHTWCIPYIGSLTARLGQGVGELSPSFSSLLVIRVGVRSA
jgi:hypothetical protein